MAEGHLRIKTKLDNSSLSKELKSAQKELDRFKKQEEKITSKNLEIEAKLNLDDSNYLKKRAEIERKRNIEIQANTRYSGKTPIIDSSKEQKINTKYDNQLANLGLKMEQGINKANYEMEKNNEAIKKCKKSQEEWNKKIEDTKKKMQLSELNNVKYKVDNIGNSMTDVVKKVGKWALAVFGVRSAYNAVRGAASTLSQYNKQLATDISYIQFALAKVLEPIIKALVSLVFKLLSYVNYLAKAWFNVDLFAKSSTKNFNKANTSAKKMSKTLTGWDEISQLQNNSDASSGMTAPSMDLSSMDDNFEPPEWLDVIKDFGQWIIDYWKEIVIAIGLVGLAIGGIKLFNFIKDVKDTKKGVGELGGTFKGFFDSLGKATEFIALLGGIALVVQSVTGLIDTFSQSGMTLGEVAGLLGIVLGELAGTFLILMGAMTLLEPSWQSIAGAVVIFGGLTLVIASVTKLIDTFSKSGLKLTDVIGLMLTILVTIVALMSSIAIIGPLMSAGLGPFALVIAGICATLLVMAVTLPPILEAVENFITGIAPSLIQLIITINNCINNTIYALGTVLPPIIQSVGDLFFKIFQGISLVIETVGNVIVKIMSTASTMVSTVLRSILNFINQLGPAINNFVDGAILAVTKLINFLISGIEYMINTLIIGGINNLIAAVNNIPLVDIPKLPKVRIERFKPILMASGGIIDVPKRGVPLANNVVGGEAGAEGVLPLTNEDTMARLGREIGQWITLNVDLTTKIDLRTLYREFIRYAKEQNFARNGV